MLPKEIELFSEYLRRRNYSPHTVCNYGLDLRLFFADIPKVPGQVTWRDVDRFVALQHAHGLAATTINRRLNALRSFYEFLLQEQEGEVLSPVKPSHFLRQGRPLPKKPERRGGPPHLRADHQPHGPGALPGHAAVRAEGLGGGGARSPPTSTGKRGHFSSGKARGGKIGGSTSRPTPRPASANAGGYAPGRCPARDSSGTRSGVGDRSRSKRSRRRWSATRSSRTSR